MAVASIAAPVATGALARLQDAIEGGMAPALAIMLDESLFGQVQRIAGIMAKAEGFVPKHCIGKTEVCFAITTRSLVWKLDPFAVAQATYQPVEGGKVAYEGKLVQAILEQSGRLDGQIIPTYRGDWSKVQGKFRMQRSEKSGKMYAVAAYSEADEAGLGIVVSAQVKGEAKPRSVELDLRQCHPRNSTLWATDPQTQIYYRAIRMLGNVAMPGVLMGVPFVDDLDDDDTRARRARDVTPAASAEARASAPPPDDAVLVDPDGEERAFAPGEVEGIVRAWCAECTDEQLTALVENNPDSEVVRSAVAAEQDRRSGGKAAENDPLRIEGLSAKEALGVLEWELQRSDVACADKIYAVYRDRIAKFPPNIKKGLDQLIEDKIKQEFSGSGEGAEQGELV